MITGEDRELFARGLADACASRTGPALDEALGALGWADALAVDARTAVSLLFEHQGRAAAASSALDHTMLAALDIDLTAAAPAGASTSASAAASAASASAGPDGAGADGPALVLPALGGEGPPGEVVGEGLVVRGLGTAALARARTAIVVAAGPDGPHAVDVDVVDLAPRPAAGLDPDLGLVAVAADGVRAPVAADPAPASWDEALAVGRLALAHELVGASRAMLELARVHALERVQFGRPIAGFQAVRHRLAEALVAVEAADAAVAAGWDAATPPAAASAKAVAGRSARTVARHAQQVLAGIGFTTEHPLHRYVRRTIVLDRLLGDSRRLTRAEGADILRTRHLPPILPL